MTKDELFDQTTALILASVIEMAIDDFLSMTDPNAPSRSRVGHRVRLFDRLLDFYNNEMTSAERRLFLPDRPILRSYSFITQARLEAVDRFPDLRSYVFD